MAAHLLSVVLPTHNRSGWLERAARSVLAQEGELELIIVDDASTDDTPVVSERLAADRRVRVVANPVSLGPGGSRNRGMEEARGDLVGFCDDDDTWVPGAAAAVRDRFALEPMVGVVTSWHRVVHDESAAVAVFRGPVRYGPEELLWYNLVALPFGVIRRTLFPGELSVDTSLPSCEDWDLWLRCAQHRPICTIPRALYTYHQHGGSRVTRGNDGPAVGRQRFLDKHAASMSTSCRLYHQLAVSHLRGGRPAVAARAATQLGSPAAATCAGSLFVAGAAAGIIGARLGDPGLPARLVARLVGPRAGTEQPARVRS
ncbi:MAG: glycosyltransferase family 2 protein [Acidimicrobiales bacterium]